MSVHVHTTTVEVSTETGQIAEIDVDVDPARDTYTVTFAGAVLDQSPEALTATVQKALLAIRSFRVL